MSYSSITDSRGTKQAEKSVTFTAVDSLNLLTEPDDFFFILTPSLKKLSTFIGAEMALTNADVQKQVKYTDKV